MTSGISHGIGFGVAQRAVDAVLGPRKMEVTHTDQSGSQYPPAPPPPSRNSCQAYVDDLNQASIFF